jgi:hypothetical protein
METKFGRLFPELPAAKYGDTDEKEAKKLGKLAEKMIAGFDGPKDGPDDEESGIPSLYTYLCHFIDHDLTFDPESSFLKKKGCRWRYRLQNADLHNVYGRGPPYLYDEDSKSFLFGDPLTLGEPGTRDLQRNSHGHALIGIHEMMRMRSSPSSRGCSLPFITGHLVW